MAENITNRLPYKCDECGKRINKVNRSEMNPELCKNCYAKAELELSHEEGEHREFVKGCYLCNEERNKELEAARDDLGDHWVNVHSRRQAGCIACDAVAENDKGTVDPIWYEVSCRHCHTALDASNTAEAFTDVCKACDESIPSDGASPNLSKQVHFDHSACDHPKSAKARAQCRKTGPAAKFHGVIAATDQA